MFACARRSPARLLSAREGATALEFALVIGPFMIALFGFFQYGWALHCAGNVRWATEQAARSLAMNRATTEAQVRQMVADRLQGGAPGDVTVTLRSATSDGVTLAYVDSTYVHHVVVPMIPTINLSFQTHVVTPVSQT